MKAIAIIILIALASCAAPQQTTMQQDLEQSIRDGFGPGAEVQMVNAK